MIVTMTRLAGLLALAASATAHSWIEQMQLISSNGSYTGDLGYPRGYVARTDPAFNGYSDKWQLPSPETELGRIRINASDYLCHPFQRTANYTTQFPKLKVTPDSYIAMRYLENGHVTQPWVPAGKPAGSGTVFVYGTYTPSNDEKLVDVLQWTTDGKGGNGKGFLLTAQNFDDERCRQPNVSPISVSRQMSDTDMPPGQESWCETDLHIPQDAKAGATLSIYWVWSWQTSTETEGAPCGKDEYYTTCADVDISSDIANNRALFNAPVLHTLIQQDPRSKAVSNYKSRTAFMTTPNLVTTEACGITSVTMSTLSAAMTQHTNLPEDYMATWKQLIQGKPQSTTVEPPAAAASSASSSSVIPIAASGMLTTTVREVSIQTVTYLPPTSSLARLSSSSKAVTTTSTSTLTSSSTTTATTTIAKSSSTQAPAFSYNPINAIADSDGMIGQSADTGMIGQKARRQAVPFTA